MKSDKMAAIHNSQFTIRNSAAFTIVELLVVISIIAILAAMLLPVLSVAKKQTQKRQAQLQISDIVSAIQQYDSAYSRFPVSSAVQAAAGTNDFTYGGVLHDAAGKPSGTVYTTPTSVDVVTNTEVIAILMDITNTTVTAVNANHQKNPQQTLFLNAKMVSNTNSPGVGPDLVYRDPWSNPYIISMDLNYDEQCSDSFYSHQLVSQNPPPPPIGTTPYAQTGFNGLFNPNTTATIQSQKDNFLYHGKVMVWSAGPDGKIDPTSPASGPAAGANKDNILSWQ